MPKPAVVGAALLVGGLAAAACGSTASQSATPKPGAPPAPATVQISTVSGVGPVLTDPSGHTLYLLSADHQAVATCLASAVCAHAWPPLELSGGAKTAVAGAGVQSSPLSTIAAPGGQRQVTYNQWPLYSFVGDTARGQDKGQGLHSFGGIWSALTATGQAAAAAPAPPAAPPSGSSSGSYGGFTTQPAPPTNQPALPVVHSPPNTTGGIPQGGGGDGDGDNHGGANDGDGNV